MARRIAPALLLSLAFPHLLPARAHDGDPKVLDRVPPYMGPGLRTGRPGVGSTLASMSGQTFPASNVRLLSWVPLIELNVSITGNSCTGYTSPSGREYALIGTRNCTAFVEVSDPGDPRVVALVPGPNSLWRDMRVYQHWCYSVSEGGDGIQVLDLAGIDAGQVQNLGTVTTGGVLSTHTVFVNADTGFLYRAGGDNNGLRIYSLANPASPALVATWSDRYVHEVTAVKYTSGPYAGKEIAFCCGGYNGGFSQTGLDILDVTNKQNIQLVKRFFYSNAGYSHQCWPTEDRKVLYLDDELDEKNFGLPCTTKVIDIQNLSNPVEKPSFTNGNPSIGHNLYVRGNRLYEANYRSGLHVFDCTNALQPSEIAWFDTWPDDDAPSFNGLWNVYPYFNSGVVIGSDIERGLFVWWVGAPLVDATFPSGLPDPVPPAGQDLALQLVEQPPGSFAAGSAKLHYDLGAGWVTVDLVPQGGLAFTAPLPAASCGQHLRFYLSYRSTNGVTWTSPDGGPTFYYTATVAQSAALALSDPIEQKGGWSWQDIGDDATQGLWEHGNPFPTQAQPDDDHTLPPGVNCWFTGQGTSFGTLGEDDVDGGKTTLTSPPLDLSTLAEPVIGYWRWYCNSVGPAPSEDVFTVQVSSDWVSWKTVEVVGPAGPGTAGGWFKHQFRLRDFLTPGPTVLVRFIASDYGNESIVEAAVDDLEVLDVACPPAGPVVYCTPKANSQGCAPSIGFTGLPSATSASPFLITAANEINQKAGVLFYGFGPAGAPFQGGTLCVQPPVVRTPQQLSGGNPPPDDCSGSYAFDFNAWIQAGTDPALVAGAQVDAQYWGRDPQDPSGFGTSLSDALEFTILP